MSNTLQNETYSSINTKEDIEIIELISAQFVINDFRMDKKVLMSKLIDTYIDIDFIFIVYKKFKDIDYLFIENNINIISSYSDIKNYVLKLNSIIKNYEGNIERTPYYDRTRLYEHYILRNVFNHIYNNLELKKEDHIFIKRKDYSTLDKVIQYLTTDEKKSIYKSISNKFYTNIISCIKIYSIKNYFKMYLDKALIRDRKSYEAEYIIFNKKEFKEYVKNTSLDILTSIENKLN
ncbi:MAG: hypothetical protein JXR51_08345 [Bacteroidales bacterium]|nr:hypothetical protein [Bacteroidales bacterium]